MDNNFISTFTPSLMSANTLEAIFVQRHKLAEDLIESVCHSAETANKHFRLLIGMRGIGKTHTIALIYHSLKKREYLQNKLLIAWLKEEEWGLSSWLDLLIRIFNTLETEYPELYKIKLKENVDFLYQLSPDEATYQAERILKGFIGNKTLLLLTENLDQIFNGLGDIGQKQFRAYLQNYNLITIIATSQSLFAGVSEKELPFYGFFATQYLDKLTIEEATELLRNIAELQEAQELESFINSPMGKDRIKAIHHLAGGNHRVYVIFSQFLTRNSLDELVKPVMKTLDELTPYYQARMQWLSPQQRKMIELLCTQSNALPVKEIAQRCFISPQTASGQLKDLRKKGYVTAEGVGRESFYELQEPLMRICLEAKKQRGEPIKLFIDFLRIWYSKKELKERLQKLQKNCLERDYINHALSIKDKESEKNADDSTAWYNKGVKLYELKRFEESIIWYNKALELKPDYFDAWYNKGVVLYKLKKLDEAIESFDKTLELKPNHVNSLSNKGVILHELKQFKKAMKFFDKALELKSDDHQIWNYKGLALYNIGEFEDAIESYKKALDLKPDYVEALNNRGVVFVKLQKLYEAIESYKKALDLKPDHVETLDNLQIVLTELGRLDEVLEYYNKALDYNSKNVDVLNDQGVVLAKLGKPREAKTSFDKALELEPDHVDAWDKRGMVVNKYRIEIIFQLNNWKEGFKQLDDALKHSVDQKESYTGDTTEYIQIIWDSTRDIDVWKSRIQKLVSIYDKHKLVSNLSKGMVDHIPTIMSEMVSDKLAGTWLEIWQSIVGDKRELSIALRFLKIAVEYKESKGDRRVLMKLAKEEREILEPLVKIQ